MLSKTACSIGVLSFALLTTLSGCKKDLLTETIEEEIVSPLSATELCKLYEVYISLTDPLQGAPGGPLCSQNAPLNHNDLTSSQTQLLCRAGSPGFKWGEKLLTDLETNRISVDWEKGRACLEGSLALRQAHPPYKLLTEPKWKELQEGDCHHFYQGKILDGETCVRDWDCQQGSWCSSETPFSVGTRFCIKERGLGEACNAHLPCEAHLICEEQGCINILDRPAIPELGSSCTLSDEGNPCTAAGACIGCRPVSAGAPTTCEIQGGEGEHCEVKSHCVSDLGCTNNVCTTVNEGSPCMSDSFSNSQSLCETGTLCVDLCWKNDGDSSACEQVEGCTFSEDSGYCNTDEMVGTCTSAPQIGSACLLGTYCGASAFCDATTDTCIAPSLEGEACMGSSEDNPQGSCTAGLVCQNSTCRGYCTYNEDCVEGQYCDQSSETELPSCKPLTASTCKFDSQCNETEYCDRCELQNYNQAECNIDMDCSWVISSTSCLHVCATLSDEAQCGTDSQCSWNEATLECGSSCTSVEMEGCNTTPGCGTQIETTCTMATECFNFSDAQSCTDNGCHFSDDGDYCSDYCTGFVTSETCSAEASCRFDADWQYCTSACPALSNDQTGCTNLAACAWNETTFCAPSTTCMDFTTSDTACNAQDECQWQEEGTCGEATPETVFQCTPKVSIGEKCSSDTMCSEQGQCAYDEDEETRCQYLSPNVDPSCNYTSMGFLRGAFLLGFIFTLRRRRQRAS